MYYSLTFYKNTSVPHVDYIYSGLSTEPSMDSLLDRILLFLPYRDFLLKSGTLIYLT